MRYNPVAAAYERMQAVNNVKLYKGLLRTEMDKDSPNFEVAKYYRSRINKYEDILGIGRK